MFTFYIVCSLKLINKSLCEFINILGVSSGTQVTEELAPLASLTNQIESKVPAFSKRFIKCYSIFILAVIK